MQKLAAEKKQVTTKILEEVSSRIGFKMSDLKKQSPSTICNRTRPGNRPSQHLENIMPSINLIGGNHLVFAADGKHIVGGR